MQELVFVERGKLEWRERDAPRVEGAGEALVRPLVVTRCDLDRAIVTGVFPMAGPFAVGHETVGEVLEVGSGVTRVRPGDRVVVPFQISCGACDRCARGFTGSCREVPLRSSFGLGPLSGREWGGALSDVIRVPYADAMLVALPEGLDPMIAAGAADNVSDGWRTVAEPLAQLPGAPVLVVGGAAESIGLYAVASARALGASEVAYVDHDEARLAIASALGARVVPFARDAKPGRFAITVDASARTEGLRLALACTDVEGTCTSVGVYTTEVSLPLLELYSKGVRFLTGRAHARAVLPEVLAKLADRTLAIDAVTMARVMWGDARDAWGEPATKMVVARE
ncbi:zinc-dependent alcohol dehydrogenase [Sandaracinus amylolyticus]|nr:alcohol dehydrogenase catalytic domain-containing protein [Sandaracinus amylolyticus]